MVDYSDSWTPAGNFGIVTDTDTTGGFRVVADSSERLSVPAQRRKKGMRIAQADTGVVYILTTDNTGTLTEADFAQEPTGDIGSSINNTFSGVNTFNPHYITGSITGSDAKFVSITSSMDLKVGEGPAISVGRGTGDNDFSVAFGHESLSSNVNGYSNVAMGYRTLKNNTDGYTNVAIGNSTMRDNTLGFDNTAVGSAAMLSNSLGSYNVAIGRYAMYENEVSFFNTAVGAYALTNLTGTVSETIGSTAVGAFCLRDNITGSRNTGIGSDCLANNTYGSDNTAVGSFALFNNLTGSSNIAVGYQASHDNNFGNHNVAIGREALYQNYSGSSNVAIGNYSSGQNYSGVQNVSVGYASLNRNKQGNYNVSIGNYSLYGALNSSVDRNTSIGNVVLYSLEKGERNTALGNGALYYTLSGSRNVAIGNVAGLDLLTGSYNIFIGDSAGIGETHLDNTVIIRTDQERLRIDSDGLTNIKGPLVADVSISGTVSSPITSTSYLLSSTDRGKTLLFSNSSQQTITCPPSLNVGFNCTFVQMGAGQLVLLAGSGVTLINRQSHTGTAGQYAAMSTVVIDTDTYLVAGDTA